MSEPLPPVATGRPDDARYLRQVLLFGEEGQARLAAAEARCGPGLAGDVAARYAAGAGMRVARTAGPGEDSRSAEGVSDAAAAEVLEGARAALGPMLRALEP